MEDKKVLQEKYFELQLLAQNIKKIQQNLEVLENQFMELLVTEQNLDDLKKLKPKTETIVQVTPGIFTKAELKNPSEVIVNIGADTVVRKDIPSTKALIDKQKDEMQKVQNNLTRELQKMILRARSLEEEINELSKK